ncbi:MAG: family 2 glycosyl transferase [Leptolyngbyaceae cyanobacterium SM1_1_3]|nr:family 2 glycosyl transferase [Leptolyngbyaceae cyanobacterium SM1_1_3]NJN02241.1 family 2 glycosyl transferase [Leptolyngbyaceae cyanobacterium RM1_1_2]
MSWEVCIQYACGKERVLRTYQNLEVALNCVDRIYAVKGYPLHLAYCVRPSYIA